MRTTTKLLSIVMTSVLMLNTPVNAYNLGEPSLEGFNFGMTFGGIFSDDLNAYTAGVTAMYRLHLFNATIDSSGADWTDFSYLLYGKSQAFGQFKIDSDNNWEGVGVNPLIAGITIENGSGIYMDIGAGLGINNGPGVLAEYSLGYTFESNISTYVNAQYQFSDDAIGYVSVGISYTFGDADSDGYAAPVNQSDYYRHYNPRSYQTSFNQI